MKLISRCFDSLESAGFLKTIKSTTIPTTGDCLPHIQLLGHGQAYALQLQKKWKSLRNLAVQLKQSNDKNATNRTSFLKSNHLREQMQQLRQDYPRRAKCPTLVKHEKLGGNASHAHNTIFQYNAPITQLITDFYVEPHRGLEHFYNVQRESKIWWMRYSSNPSRYSIVPCDIEEYQAIDIKASFGDGKEVTVEQLTLAQLPPLADFELPDARTGKILIPSIIRSVIELEPATCALLFDGCEIHSLHLNRVLAPYQCAIICEQSHSELHELREHLEQILHKANLRLSPTTHDDVKSASTLDTLGVPYTLLINEKTLVNGLLQLRNRDTRLAETIHISDIPNYLLNIFNVT